MTLSYDPGGRLYEEAGTATTKFLYDGSDIIAEYDGSSSLLRRYVHGPGADEPLVWLEGSGAADRRFLHADARGSVIAVSDAGGDVTDKNTYDPYGAPGPGNIGRFQYTGQIWLAEAKLYHYKARAYNPAIGRFMQTDPIGYADGMNMYAYVGNDPVNGSDPSGLSGGCTGSRIVERTTTSDGHKFIQCTGGGHLAGAGFSSLGRASTAHGGGGGRPRSSGASASSASNSAGDTQSGFVGGSSSSADYGDEIVVTATRSYSYTRSSTGFVQIH